MKLRNTLLIVILAMGVLFLSPVYASHWFSGGQKGGGGGDGGTVAPPAKSLGSVYYIAPTVSNFKPGVTFGLLHSGVNVDTALEVVIGERGSANFLASKEVKKDTRILGGATAGTDGVPGLMLGLDYKKFLFRLSSGNTSYTTCSDSKWKQTCSQNSRAENVISVGYKILVK